MKILKAIALVTLGIPILGSSLPPVEPLVGLNTYVSTANGYAYDTSRPVYYYSGSPEQVRIPAEYTAEKRQFRGSWVPTVNNISLTKPTNEADFHTQFEAILDHADTLHLNSIIFQVRPGQDAFYRSTLNPWSQFLSGTQGKDPGYDPLTWMINATHQRGMEYHAWLNPYRVTTTSLTSAGMLAALKLTASQASALTAPEAIQALAAAGVLSADNYAVIHPDQVLLFNGTLFLDPGNPAVIAHVVDSVREVATNYDIDAIHHDDYFYPYNATINGATVSFASTRADHDTFEKYGVPNGYPDTETGIADWRRESVTALIRGIRSSLDTVNAESGKSIQFGVSPFGIWQHSSVDPRGSHTPTSSTSSYSVEFADTYSWVKNNLLDYIAPQIYWSFDQAAAPYGELARWWNQVVSRTNVRLYIGHANYKHVANGPREAAWMNPDEIPHQMLFNQTLDRVSGSIFYGYNDIVPSNPAAATADTQAAVAVKNAAISRLSTDMLSTRALTPATPARANPRLSAPVAVSLDSNTSRVSWKDGSPGASRSFAVYQGTGTPNSIIASPTALISQVYANDSGTYSAQVKLVEGSTIVVTALDRASNESAAAVADSPVKSNTLEQNSSGKTARDATLAATGSSISQWLILATGTVVLIGAALWEYHRRVRHHAKRH